MYKYTKIRVDRQYQPTGEFVEFVNIVNKFKYDYNIAFYGPKLKEGEYEWCSSILLNNFNCCKSILSNED